MIFVLAFFLNVSMALDFEKTEIVFQNGKNLTVELADTFIKRNKGLMYRSSMPENQGMLFIFDRSEKLSFWNKNTFIPLSVGYFDKNRVLKEIHLMQAQSMLEKDPIPKTYPSKCNCKYVVEVNQGWFKKNKIKLGSHFQFSKNRQR